MNILLSISRLMRSYFFIVSICFLCWSPSVYGGSLEEAMQKAAKEQIQLFLKTATLKQQNQEVCNAIEREDAFAVEALVNAGAECLIQYSKIPILIKQGKEKGLTLLENYAQNRSEAKGQVLWYAISLGHPHLITIQISKGIDLNQILVEKQLSYLMFAAKSGSAEIASLLLRGGADVNQKNSAKKTALHFAAGHDLETVELLVARGANVNDQDKKGLRPIDFALIRNKVLIFSFLQKNKSKQPHQKTMRQAVRLMTMFERYEIANLLWKYYPEAIQRLPAAQQSLFSIFLKNQPDSSSTPK